MSDSQRSAARRREGSSSYHALVRLARRATLRPGATPEGAIAEVTTLLGREAVAAGVDPRAELAWLLLCLASGATGAAITEPDEPGSPLDESSEHDPADHYTRLFYAIAPSYEAAREYFAASPTGSSLAAFRALRGARLDALWAALHPPLDLLLDAPPLAGVAAHMEGPLVCLLCHRRAALARAAAGRAAATLAAASPPDLIDGAEHAVRAHSSGEPLLVRYVVDDGYLRCFVTPHAGETAEYRLEFLFRTGLELSAHYAWPRDSFGGVNLGRLRGTKLDELSHFRIVRISPTRARSP